MKRLIAMTALACLAAGCSQTTETTTSETTTQTLGAPTTSVASAEVPRVAMREPPTRLMRIGVPVLLDNGKCPAGQVQSMVKPNINIGKIYTCVDDPRS
ncbi:MAG: hypothetical protein INR68_04245 [Methylobacterium mesophilicum]|nr:hypothetical protein [Methylobacterium mesophilicum]